MIRIYFDDANAIVVDEYRRSYYFTSRDAAKVLVKGIKAAKSYRQALNQREEILIGYGYQKVDLGGAGDAK